MDIQRLYDRHAAGLEDFWGRRDNRPQFRRDFYVFGRAMEMRSNREDVLAAVDHSLPLFSTVPPIDRPPCTVQVVVRPLPLPPGPVDQAADHLLYTGEADWIHISLGPYGAAWADLTQGRATAIVAPELAARPDLLSRTLLNTLLLNFCLSSGYAMLHASCLMRDGGRRGGRALLLMAPHNSGKSTTALRLALNGFALLSDSMIHVVPEPEDGRRPLLAGFPVRRIKLRADMLDSFPHLRAGLQTERVRDETKYVLDLEKVDPAMVVTEAVRPRKVTLCLLARSDDEATTWAEATPDEVWAAVMANSLFYDDRRIWRPNLEALDRLLDGARCLHLRIGRDPERLVAAVEALWAEG